MTRCLPAAIACEHLSLADGIAFVDNIMRMMETYKKESFNLAFVYEMLERQQWMERAESRDPEFDITRECKVVDKNLLATARSRLQTTLQEADICDGSLSGNSMAAIDA